MADQGQETPKPNEQSTSPEPQKTAPLEKTREDYSREFAQTADDLWERANTLDPGFKHWKEPFPDGYYSIEVSTRNKPDIDKRWYHAGDVLKISVGTGHTNDAHWEDYELIRLREETEEGSPPGKLTGAYYIADRRQAYGFQKPGESDQKDSWADAYLDPEKVLKDLTRVNGIVSTAEKRQADQKEADAFWDKHVEWEKLDRMDAPLPGGGKVKAHTYNPKPKG